MGRQCVRKSVRTKLQCIVLQETTERAVWTYDGKRPRRIGGKKETKDIARFCGVFWFAVSNRVREEENSAQVETSYLQFCVLCERLAG